MGSVLRVSCRALGPVGESYSDRLDLSRSLFHCVLEE